jgi:hypothetical protein
LNKSTHDSVIPAYAGIQAFSVFGPRMNLDAGLRRHDEFLLRLKPHEGATNFNQARHYSHHKSKKQRADRGEETHLPAVSNSGAGL